MESRKQRADFNSCPPSPLPNSSPFSVFKDVSNFRTPKRPSRIPKFQSSPCSQNSQYFTAAKNTPAISSGRGFKSSVLKSKAARKLKAFEVEQLHSARKVQIEKENSLKSLSRSLTVWINFLLQNPKSCGCDTSKFMGDKDESNCHQVVVTKESLMSYGKREGRPSSEVAVDGPWRGPKRQKKLLWESAGNAEGSEIKDSMFLGLRASLREICSFDDLKDRMRMHLSLASCKEIFETMSQVAKIIDEGRLMMKKNCPVVTDVGMKERAINILMCYNLVWLRLGLHIILGGDSLLPDGDISSEQEVTFLRMVIDKQFFSHNGLAKRYAYNKQVEGLYKPGYYENLGNVVLKRILLLVIILDRAKSQTSLPLKYGIDGLDGGSPLLFSIKSSIKSSRQMIADFLSSDVMHGEGNLLAHLVIMGYKLTYQQSPLIEYDFKVHNLFEDLQDGVRLCRVIELLEYDPSILMKVVVPSDTLKKRLVNCGVALQYLRQAGVPLLDADRVEIVEEDIANRDKELTLSLLWNMFVHLQLPLLINRKILSEEILNIRGDFVEISNTQTHQELLLIWIQAICETYEFKVHSQSSLLDGKALWCLLDYYFRKQHGHSPYFKDSNGIRNEVSIMSEIEYTDAVHNFILSQKLTSLLGNFPEVLQVSDILEHNGACNGQTVIILLVFLSVQFLVKRNMGEINLHKLLGLNCHNSNDKRLSIDSDNGQDNIKDFRAIMDWWQDMAQKNVKCKINPAFSSKFLLTGRDGIVKIQRDNSATIIQSHFRRYIARKHYLKIIDAALVVQSFALAHLSMKNTSVLEFRAKTMDGHLEKVEASFNSMSGRSYFVDLTKNCTTIRHGLEECIEPKPCDESTLCKKTHITGFIYATTVIQSCIRGWMVRSALAKRVEASVLAKDELGDLHKKAAATIQHSWKYFTFRRKYQDRQHAAAKIQHFYRGWLMRKSFARKKQGVIAIQHSFRCFRCRKHFKLQREENASAIMLQAHARGWITRRKACRKKNSIVLIQRYWRRWLRRKKLLQEDAVRRIESAFLCMKLHKTFIAQKRAAIVIQRFVREENSKKRLLVVRVQRWWRDIIKAKQKIKSAIVIQSHFRGWIGKKMARSEKQQVVAIQRKLSVQEDASRRIQSAFRCMKLHKAFIAKRRSAIDIQGYARGEIGRKKHLELKILLQAVVKLQRWWREVLKSKRKSSVVIQSQFRGWKARQIAKREKKCAVVIQAYWKGYLARKDAKDQLLDLRLRMQKSAANIDDSMRLINRLVAALSELLNMRSVSNILHTCSTLDIATKLSQRCCEELVAAGAVTTLLKLIRSVSRSIPDQQILKHALSTLRNLARYAHLTEILVESHGCVEVVLWEFLRNKEEGYFIASELLIRICRREKGLKVMKLLPSFLKRLRNLVEELTRKAGHDKRNAVAKEHNKKRLRAAVELLDCIAGN